jgi:N utilization substance protein B
MSRYKTRETLMKYLYQLEFNEEITKEWVLSQEDILNLPEAEFTYLSDVVNYYFDNFDQIDNLINLYSNRWKVDRLPKVDLSILRISFTEILYMREEIPYQISVNEAINLSKKYSDDESYTLVNGILGALIKEKIGG